MRNSKYWDDFERRVDETVEAIMTNKPLPVRRVAVFITEECNFSCSYCNGATVGKTLEQQDFLYLLQLFGDSAIMHITGGEPSVVPWLYPVLEEYADRYRFHLNTNAFYKPPAEAVKRLKISLDSCNEEQWNKTVGIQAFETVVNNIKYATSKTTVSLTCTLSKQTYKGVIDLAKFCKREFPDLYALFFSVYKGTDPRFVMEKRHVDEFFDEMLLDLIWELNEESRCLLSETLDEKRRIMQGIRFPQNLIARDCYLSMSERVVSPDGMMYNCSHLYRDGILHTDQEKHPRCGYGCNRRLVQFNTEVERRINEYSISNNQTSCYNK